MFSRAHVFLVLAFIFVFITMVVMGVSYLSGIQLTDGNTKFLVGLGCGAFLCFFGWLDAEVDYLNGR